MSVNRLEVWWRHSRFKQAGGLPRLSVTVKAGGDVYGHVGTITQSSACFVERILGFETQLAQQTSEVLNNLQPRPASPLFPRPAESRNPDNYPSQFGDWIRTGKVLPLISFLEERRI